MKFDYVWMIELGKNIPLIEDLLLLVKLLIKKVVTE